MLRAVMCLAWSRSSPGLGGINSACRPCTSKACGPGRSAALAASVLWAAHNCIGPYLLAHYTWVGRGRSLARAVSAAAALTGAILAAALACLLLLTPAAYDYGQVCRSPTGAPVRSARLRWLRTWRSDCMLTLASHRWS